MKVISFDTETRGLDWFDPDHRAFLATWADGDAEYQADLSKELETKRFIAALRAADILVAHNLSFDVHHVRAATGFDILKNSKFLAGRQWLHDTDLMSRVLLPEGQRKGERGGHGLKNLSKVYLRADADTAEQHIKEMSKAIGLRTLKQTGAYYEVWRAYPKAMETYARLDARYTYDLFSKFWASLLKLPDLLAIYQLEMQVCPILIRAEQTGVQIDQEPVKRMISATKRKRNKLLKYLIGEMGEPPFNGEGSEAALREAILKLGVPLHKKTPTGDMLSTNKFALQEFEDRYPQLGALRDLRQCDKFLATYLAPMEGRDVVHPSFFQCGAWTGRMSCARPNMQNIPKAAGKDMRSMFVPRPDHSFVVCDYDSIEVRLLAYYLGDQGFRDMIERGLDPHAWMASNIHGGSMDDYLKGTPGQPLRDRAKNTLFAITYGAGAPRVADMNKIPRDEAKRLISTIKKSLPGFYRLNSRIQEKVKAVGYVTTLMGRKQPVMRDKAYVGLNALIQGSAADIMKQGLVNVNDAINGFGAQVLLVVHDEVVIECPTKLAERCRKVVEQAMIDAFALSPTLAVSGTTTSESYAAA